MELQDFLKSNYGHLIQVQSNSVNCTSPYVVALHHNSSYFMLLKELTDQVYAVAQKFPQLRFFVGDWNENGSPDKFQPKTPLRIVAFRNKKKLMCQKAQDLNALTKFCTEFLNSFDFKSEPVPELPLTYFTAKTAVALNFHELVTNNKKDVMLVLYRPSEEDSENEDFLALLDKLATVLYGNNEHFHIDVVRMNVAANTLLLDIDGHFYMKQCIYIRKDDKTLIKKPWKDDFSVYDLLKFIAQNSTKPLTGYNRDGKAKNKQARRKV